MHYGFCCLNGFVDYVDLVVLGGAGNEVRLVELFCVYIWIEDCFLERRAVL